MLVGRGMGEQGGKTLDRTRNTPDIRTEPPVRISELKLVDATTQKQPDLKPIKPIQATDDIDVEDMWDNLPV